MAGLLDTGRMGVLVRLVVALVLSVALLARPAAAQSILRDAETEALFAEMSEPLIKAAGLRPQDVKIVLVGDPSINAFVAGGQIVYLNSGTIMQASNANEVQGVIAHELGHITGGHVPLSGQMTKGPTAITLLSLLLGAAAIAAGAGDAGAGILMAGQQAALGNFLAFSRNQESAADAAGQTYLAEAGISGRGSLSFFQKLQNQEFRLAIRQDDEAAYGRTHPLSGDRIAFLREQYQTDPAWDRPTPPTLEARFQRVKAKLRGYVNEPAQTLRDYPESDRSTPARYARAYAWHRSAYPDKALAEIDGLLAEVPNDPYFLEIKGQVLLESGRPTDALPALREAARMTGNQPLIAVLFGHALIATEDRQHFDEAERILLAAVSRDNDNPFAWYQLGVIYDRKGDTARAALATAERYNLMNQPKLALVSAERAMGGIPQGSPQWLRAQDIAMVSRVEVEKDKKRR